MIQCSECEHCRRGPGNQIAFNCDPFKNIKEPECLAKWQLLRMSESSQKLDRLVAAYEATLAMYRKWAPLQEKMFRRMEKEIDESEEADSWKYGDEEAEKDQEEEGEDKDKPPGPFTP